jgi:hypothetical protein
VAKKNEGDDAAMQCSTGASESRERESSSAQGDKRRLQPTDFLLFPCCPCLTQAPVDCPIFLEKMENLDSNDTVYAFGTKDSSTERIEKTFLWS